MNGRCRVWRALLGAALAVSLAGCTRTDSPEGTLAALHELAEKGAYAQMRTLLTPESVAAIGSIESAHPGFDGLDADFRRKFPRGARWGVIEKKASGDTVTLRLRCEKHPVQNIVGYEMDLAMRRSGGAWRIDLRGDLEALSGRYDAYRKMIQNPAALRRFLK